MKITILPAIGAILGLFLQGCGGGGHDGGGNGSEARIEVPANANEQWTMVQAADVGMDAALLRKAMSDLPGDGSHGVASMLVLRHGKPVIEQYWNGYDKDTLHDLRSATKSITSLLVGIAIDQQLLAGVNEPISKYLDAAFPAAPALKQNITLDNVLTMSSGLACDDRDTNSPGNEEKMYQTRDWTQFVLGLPQHAAPGTETHYCTGGAVVLGRVLAESSKLPIPAFSDKALFFPLGISNVHWADFDNHRQTDTGGHLRMRPRDMAKLGQLVAQNGLWNGRQVVSTAWITAAGSQHTLMDNQWKYGYLWWQKLESFHGRQVMMQFAWGNGGQYIFVIPEADLVVVFTGENYDSDKAQLPFRILERDILPSIR